VAVPIEVGEIFDCLACSPISPIFDDDVQLRERVWASSGLPVAPKEHWEKWIGTLAFDSLRRSLVLTVTAKQPKPGIVFLEALRRQLYRLQYALNLLGICGYDEAFYIAGANEKGTAEVRQFGRIRRTFYRSRDMPSTPFGLDELRRAVPLSERMEIIDKEGASWRRFRRGIDSLNDGLTERSLQDSRIHQFVRVLEGLILPEQGKSTKQFVHRCQTFALASEDTKVALEQAYNIRSQVEHLHNALDVLPGSSVEEKEQTLYHRARQMDHLARFALARVLESDALLDIFRQDSSIEAFWKKPDDERLKIWGTRLDLAKID
jgi:hypothetical protein